MADQVAIQIPKSKVDEGTNFTATAYFRTRSTAAASTPTTVHYRVDNLTTEQQVTDWTSVSAAANVSIAITPTMNAIESATNAFERKQITVQTDRGLTTQAVGHANWMVRNLRGSP